MDHSREDELIATIDGAFSGVRLEDGISLNMTEYNDSGGTASHYAELAKSDERLDWHRIGDDILESFSVTFSFTDLKGFRFYVPAYMIWTIHNHRTSNSFISDATIYAIDPDHHLFQNLPFTTWFTQRQVSAMVAFLEYCCENDGTLDGDVARANLRKIRSYEKVD